MIIKCRERSLKFGSKTLCMGILNATPDSFSDGGKNYSLDAAMKNIEEMVNFGADVIDVGGESTRPGYTVISDEEEISRIVPVIKNIRENFDVTISVDTYKSGVAKAALDSGAHIINDITGLMADSKMASVIKEYDAGAVLMFNKRTKGDSFEEGIVFRAVDELCESIKIAKEAGISDDRIILDPGIGFGTTREEDQLLIRNLRLLSMGDKYPVLLALSRKRVVADLLGRETQADERDAASIGLGIAGVTNGADMLRVHNVKDTVDALKCFDAIFR